MKHIKSTTIFLALALTVMFVAEAEADWLGKTKKKARTEKTEEMKKPAEFNKYPTMSFVGGILSQTAHSGWKIGETPLYLHSECVISMADSEDGFLEEGRHATVMGARMGGAISAYSIFVSLPEYQTQGMGST
jgi:hypothetical protein